MATSDQNFDGSLREDLTNKEKKNDLCFGGGENFSSENEKEAKPSTDETMLEEMKDIKNSTDRTDHVICDEKKECGEKMAEQTLCEADYEYGIERNYSSNLTDGERERGHHSSKNKQPFAGNINEALLEEDERAEDCSDGDENYESAEEHLTPEEAEDRLKEAMELKKEGNELFRKQEYSQGKDLYSKAIRRCPKEFAQNKSICYSNRAACSQKMEDYESAISDCTQALDLDPTYLKARLRRAQCYEKVEKLEEALEDYKIVFEKDKSCEPAREAIIRLPEEIRIKHEKLKEEMIGKLKELGNMVLRPFGLSTDNFKLQQDPNSGGYSINFQK